MRVSATGATEVTWSAIVRELLGAGSRPARQDAPVPGAAAEIAADLV